MYEIRELTVGEILDTAFRLLRDRFWLLTGIFSIFTIPLALLEDASDRMTSAGCPRMALAFLALAVIALLMEFYAQMAATQAVSEHYLGRATSIGRAYAATRPIIGPYLGTMLFEALLLIPAVLLLVVPAIYMVVCWALIGPIAIVERSFGWSGLKRSRSLMRGRWWRSVLLLFTASLLLLVMTAMTTLVGFIPFVGPVVSGFAQAVSTAFIAIVLVLMYFDLRCRVEDFDLTQLAERMGAASPEPARAAAPVR